MGAQRPCLIIAYLIIAYLIVIRIRIRRVVNESYTQPDNAMARPLRAFG